MPTPTCNWPRSPDQNCGPLRQRRAPRLLAARPFEAARVVERRHRRLPPCLARPLAPRFSASSRSISVPLRVRIMPPAPPRLGRLACSCPEPLAVGIKRWLRLPGRSPAPVAALPDAPPDTPPELGGRPCFSEHHINEPIRQRRHQRREEPVHSFFNWRASPRDTPILPSTGPGRLADR